MGHWELQRKDCFGLNGLSSLKIIKKKTKISRGLEFMLELLKQIVAEYRKSAESGSLAKTESLTGSLRLAYEKTLKRHHNFVSKQLFKVFLQEKL